MKNRVKIRSLNAYNYRHDKENPIIIDIVRHTPTAGMRDLASWLCTKVTIKLTMSLVVS
jgi:hypothetical protein